MENKILLVSVNMGYGHQRTAFPLKKFAYENRIINANDYNGMSKKDRAVWENSKKFYEFVSRFKRVPLLGGAVFSIFDKFQKIEDFYPKRNLSSPNFMTKKVYRLFKKGWGKDFIKQFDCSLPMVSTFFIPAFMAEFFDYKGDIFCVVCDADISRSWAPLIPQKSRIKYLVPNLWTLKRLKMYGVKEENIFLTGYPLPLENIGDEKMEVLKKDIAFRLLNLDKEGEYRKKNNNFIFEKIESFPKEERYNLTIAFSIGGAGAQKEIALKMIKGISEEIKKKEISIVIMAGIREKVRDFFAKELNSLGLLSENVKIVYSEKIEEYFTKFNKEIRKTDILWTKPSELSFYCALGLPIIIAPPLGSQEDFNKKWLLKMGAGISQENPLYFKEWLFDYLKSGRFAQCAINGFTLSEKMGTLNIEKICRLK
ncbi:MAG: hypothetical protein PHH17_00635 [Candidatus Pacebacteria bacterium]|jgi:hypothetical protein|nr:hypothetical protein [Candidatus Paceibacterota bacterium]MDD3072340.1 hypothetical protein [Candidatus Paceibacterota bacterium]MDD3728730.1 hypothetical protein [Candidatus Paceibacterota bacterium]MDD4201412.1 hypothetical protein [Candidatus Paceibacterota bacterium]MDD4466851.1 hypothetical protein [Candidatus Paceibacterota bacterium]